MDLIKRSILIFSIPVVFSAVILALVLHASESTNEGIGDDVDRAVFGPGDNKQGYESADYRTHSLDLQQRIGKEAKLIDYVYEPPLGLPSVPVPEDNPVTTEKIRLGRKLFFDRRLSINDTFSCAICHIPEQGFTNNEIKTAVGVEGRTVKRNSPTVYNAAYLKKIFHDGRETTLEQQVWSPLLARNEMANPSIGYVISKIKAIREYDGLFEAAFEGRGPTMETVGMALASYQRTLNAANSPFDIWYYDGDENAVSEQVKNGFKLFTGKAVCSVCHLIQKEFALFSDDRLHNTGVGYLDSMGIEPETRRVQLAPGVYTELDTSVIRTVSRSKENDLGLYEITENPNDRWKYRTPTLRNVALTAPYMHNGSLSTLRDVIDFYNQGGIPNELLSPLIRPLGLTDSEIDELVAFLQSLTGNNVSILVKDAFAAPIGDISADDPNWAHENKLEF